MGIIQIIVLCGLLVTSVKGSTHWVVTEGGKVQEQLESPFAINQPHDLVAFMKQETNHAKMQEIKEVLVVDKKRIEENEDKELDLEETHYLNDEDCIAAGKHLTEFDLFVSSVLPLENKEIEVSDLVDFTKPDGGVTLHKPDCVKMPTFTSLHTKYDNFEGVVNRKNLQLYRAELGVKSTLNYMENMEELANAIDSALKKNSSSWVAHNLAALYWRMKGDAEKAVECARRAIFFSPHQYKDVALVSLANILHRSRYSINASVILEEALEISDTSIIHFALGNIYAIMGDFDPSMHHYEKTLEGQPDFSAAKKRLHAVKCHHKLQLKLEAQHESLQRTLMELEAYQEKHKTYIEMYQTIENMQLPRQEQINMHLLFMQYLIQKGKFDHRLCKFRSDNGSPVMSCNLPRPGTDLPQKDVELIPNINARKKQNKQNKKNEQDVRGHVPDAKPTTFASGDGVGIFQVPEQFENIAICDWRDPNWPTEDMCSQNAPRNLAWDEFPSTYINPEARGFPVRELLTSYIGVKEGENVPQPWSELNCESLEPVCEKTVIDKIQGIMDRHSAPMHKQDLYVKRELLLHLNEGYIWPGDFAHRINIAIKKSLQEKKDENLWVLYNIAGLYFRVYGDNLKAVECIRRGLRRTPKEHSDILLVNVANIMYRLGKINDALMMLVDTLFLNRTEPLTYLTVGNVLQAKGNVSGALTFYEYGQYLDNNFQANFWALLNVKCATLRERTLNSRLKTKDSHVGNAQATCDEDSTPFDGQSVLMDNIRSTKNPDDHVLKTEQTSDGMKMYTVHAFSSQETKVTTECENSSDETDLVRRLESTKEDADKILHDADAVIQRLSHVAKDSSEELSFRVSSARKIMHQLSQMRENLGSLVEEASSSLDTAEKSPYKEQFSPSECAHVLQNVDLRSYFSSDMDIGTRGYDFGEELPSPGVKSPGTAGPFCFPPSASEQYNVDDLKTVINRAKFVSYDEERGMESLLKQLIPSDSGNQDFSVFIRQLSEGMMQHPTSWRLAFLSSYYWRLKGKAKEAIDCLRVSLSTVPLDMRDVVLLGLSNVFAQLSQWQDAIHVTEQAVLLYPDYFLYHFTLANIFAAMGDVHSSIPYFRRALQLQRLKKSGDREIAQRRLEAAICEIQRTGVH